MFKYYLLCILGFFAFTVASAPGQDIDPENVRQAIVRGIAYLKDKQLPDGSWTVEGANERCGSTAIAVIAMRSCGVPPNDPSIQRAMRYLRTFSADQAGRNYSLALHDGVLCC